MLYLSRLNHDFVTGMNIKPGYLVLLLILVWTLVSCNNQKEEPETRNLESPKTEFNTSYGSHAQQVYDLYLPANRSTSTTKTVIVIHGGGWTSGDKNDVTGLVGLIRRALPDHAVVNMNYRLANGTNRKAFPDQITDIQNLINNLVANQNEYGINGTFALYGISAGAHIAVLYAYTQNADNRVKAIINMVGPVDFTDPYYNDNATYKAVLASFIDATAYPAGFNASVALSPAKQVTRNSPPTISFYGDADPVVPSSQLTRLDAALTSKNVAHTSTLYTGGHGNWNGTQYADLQAQVKTFIEENY